MFWGHFTSLKACSVSVTVGCVFFSSHKIIFGSKTVRRGPRRPEYMCNIILGICCCHVKVNCSFPIMLGPSPCRPLLFCPIQISGAKFTIWEKLPKCNYYPFGSFANPIKSKFAASDLRGFVGSEYAKLFF